MNELVKFLGEKTTHFLHMFSSPQILHAQHVLSAPVKMSMAHIIWYYVLYSYHNRLSLHVCTYDCVSINALCVVSSFASCFLAFFTFFLEFFTFFKLFTCFSRIFHIVRIFTFFLASFWRFAAAVAVLKAWINGLPDVRKPYALWEIIH